MVKGVGFTADKDRNYQVDAAHPVQISQTHRSPSFSGIDKTPSIRRSVVAVLALLPALNEQFPPIGDTLAEPVDL